MNRVWAARRGANTLTAFQGAIDSAIVGISRSWVVAGTVEIVTDYRVPKQVQILPPPMHFRRRDAARP